MRTTSQRCLGASTHVLEMKAHWHLYYGHDCYTYPTTQCFSTQRAAIAEAECELGLQTTQTRALRKQGRLSLNDSQRTRLGLGRVEILRWKEKCEICS